MSVFVCESAEEGSNRNRKTRKKYYTKYSLKYKEEYPWALPSTKGDLHAFCHLCFVDISIKTVGAKGLRDHEATCRHSQKAHEMGLGPSVTMPISEHQRVGLAPNLSCIGDGQASSNSFNALSNVEVVFANSASGYPPQPPQNFIQPTVMRSQQQMCSTMAHPALLSSTHSSSLPSSVYPVLEVEESEDQPNCRSPQAPQTPNTPSNPLTQDHFVPLGNKLSSSTPNPLVDLQRDLQCQMTGEMASTEESFHCINKASNNTSPSHQLKVENCEEKSNQISSGYSEQSNSDKCQTHLPNFRSPNIVDLDFNIKNTSKSKLSDSSEEIDRSNCAKDLPTTATDDNKGSSSPSVEDLTCNICGEIFLDWKDLKKDLMNHIREANQKVSTPKSFSPDSKESSNKRREKREIKFKKMSESRIKEPEIIPKRKRGRPHGWKKKMLSAKQDTTLNSTCDDSHIVGNPPNDNELLQYTSANNKQKMVKHRGRPKVKSDVEDIEKVNYKEEEDFVLSSNLASRAEDKFCDGVLEICQQQMNEDSSQERLSDSEVRNEPVPNRRSGQLQCRVCRAIFYLRQELKDHCQLEHNNGRPYECDVCHKFFTTKNNLEVHRRHKHTEGPNPCLCSICGKLLSSRTNLKIHMMIHKGERPYCCPVCTKEFSRKANMEMHMVYHTGERRFTCEVCGQSFFAINALKRHKKLHTGERDYACDICGATYVTGTDLRRHRLKHDDVKPFPCSICDKQFTRSHDLKVHLRYHNKELRFTCSICNKQFVESGNYRRHMRRHTGERPYTCNLCLQSFSQVHHYKVHLKTSHSDQTESISDMISVRGRPSIHKNPPLNQKANYTKRSSKITQNHSNTNGHQSSMDASVVTTVGTLTNSLQEMHNVHVLNTSSHNQTPITSVSTVGNIGEMHHNHSVTGTPPVAHTGNVSGVMMPHHSQIDPATGINQHATGFLQSYNSYIYNTSVIPQYQTIFDICPQQNSSNHLGTH